MPLKGQSNLDLLIADGRATAADGDLLDIKPIAPIPGQRRLSEVLAELRADER